MPRFSDDFLSQLRLRCDIEQIISSYVNLKRRGRTLVGLCPFHNEKTPSFTVYPDTQSFYCFGCSAGGEVISFIKRIENLSFTDAVRFLCDRVGLSMPVDGIDTSMAQKRKEMLDINREAARFFNTCLFSEEGKAGLDYYKSRGYTKKTIIRFGLGYAPNSWDSLLKHMRQKGYSYEQLYQANLANKSEKNGKTHYYDSFRNRVIVPIIDVRGNVVAFGGRVLDDSKPKYVNTSDTLVYKKSLGVFGLNFAKNSKQDSLLLVEGYMDAISLHQAGFDNAVACLGTALTGEMAHLIMRYANEVIICYDADEAGSKATQRAIDIFKSIGAKMRVIRPSGGKDPDEILKKYGPERFRSLLEGASNDIEFALAKEKQAFDLESDDGKLKYLTKAVEILAANNNSIATDIYSSRIAQELGVDKQTILTRVNMLSKRNRNAENKEKLKNLQRSSMTITDKTALTSGSSLRSVKAQERVIAILIENPDFLPLIYDRLNSDDFTSQINKKLFEQIEEKIRNGESLAYSAFAASLSDEEMSALVRISHNGRQITGSKKELIDCIDTILSEKTKAQKSNISVANLSDEEFKKLFEKQ